MSSSMMVKRPLPSATVAPVGFALGGNLTLKLLGEPLDGIPVVAGAAISAPLDLALGSQHLSKATFGAYERYLIAKMRRDITRPGTAVTAEERARVARVRATLLHRGVFDVTYFSTWEE